MPESSLETIESRSSRLPPASRAKIAALGMGLSSSPTTVTSTLPGLRSLKSTSRSQSPSPTLRSLFSSRPCAASPPNMPPIDMPPTESTYSPGRSVWMSYRPSPSVCASTYIPPHIEPPTSAERGCSVTRSALAGLPSGSSTLPEMRPSGISSVSSKRFSLGISFWNSTMFCWPGPPPTRCTCSE